MNAVTNESLVETIKSLRGDEKRIVAELIRCLHELDKRKHYRELGYSSLHAFCTECLGYSEAAAWRRISAARALDTCPELPEKLERGELSLCTASQLARVVTPENKSELFAQTEGKSRREVDKVLSGYLPERAAPRRMERVRVSSTRVSETPLFQAQSEAKSRKTFTVTLELTEDEMALVEEAPRVLSSSKVKDALIHSARKVVQRKKALDKKRSERAAKKKQQASHSSAGGGTPVCSAKPSRYIPADVRHAVEKRDLCQCTYVAPDGRRCSEKNNLQFDHLLPHALGGESSVENLRLLCSTHNRLEAERVFGETAIRGLVRFKQAERLSG